MLGGASHCQKRINDIAYSSHALGGLIPIIVCPAKGKGVNALIKFLSQIRKCNEDYMWSY